MMRKLPNKRQTFGFVPRGGLDGRDMRIEPTPFLSGLC